MPHRAQNDLFPASGLTKLTLPDADVTLHRSFLSPHEADACFATLRENISWQQDEVTVFQQRHPLPRLHQWYGDPGTGYAWSGITLVPQPWIPALAALRTQVSERTKTSFNTVLANLYRDGNDTVGWHADDEPELGPRPVIASLSLGATREFKLRHQTKDIPTVTLSLPHGSLLVMAGDTQRHWVHQVPRRKRAHDERINLTFRYTVPVEARRRAK